MAFQLFVFQNCFGTLCNFMETTFGAVILWILVTALDSMMPPLPSLFPAKKTLERENR
jgi:hypothetical protein